MDLLADGRPVRQRLRLRLSEQPLVVVADDAAAGRGASADRLRAAVRRGRQRRRPPRRAAEDGPACSTRSRDDIARLQNKLGPERSRPGRPVPRHRPRGRAADPEGRGRRRRTTRCRISIGPVGVPAAYADHARLMFDLQVLALQGDVTRVITFQLARETSNRTYPEIGVPDPHHPLTHHGNDPEKIAQDGEDQRVPRVAVRRSSSRS